MTRLLVIVFFGGAILAGAAWGIAEYRSIELPIPTNEDSLYPRVDELPVRIDWLRGQLDVEAQRDTAEFRAARIGTNPALRHLPVFRIRQGETNYFVQAADGGVAWRIFQSIRSGGEKELALVRGRVIQNLFDAFDERPGDSEEFQTFEIELPDGRKFPIKARDMESAAEMVRGLRGVPNQPPGSNGAAQQMR